MLIFLKKNLYPCKFLEDPAKLQKKTVSIKSGKHTQVHGMP